MLPDAVLDDLLDVFDGLVVVLQAVVAQGDVVGQRWRSDRQEDRGNKMNISRATSENTVQRSLLCGQQTSTQMLKFN